MTERHGVLAALAGIEGGARWKLAHVVKGNLSVRSARRLPSHLVLPALPPSWRGNPRGNLDLKSRNRRVSLLRERVDVARAKGASCRCSTS